MKEKIYQAIESYCAEHHNFSFDPKHPIVRLHEPTFSAEEINAAIEPLLSTHVTMGKEVRTFEEQYAKFFDYKYGVMSNSGSSANLLAIAALSSLNFEHRFNPGDEVIVPALSWSTSVFPLIQYGLRPVFVDCDINTLNINIEELEQSINEKTKGIMLVHVYGNPVKMDAVMEIVNKHNLLLIEDTCESMGATYNNKPLGSFGKIGTFSFYFSHHITTLEGGISVTNDLELTETMRIIRAHGWSREADGHKKYTEAYPDIDPRFIFVNLGYNLRPTEVQAKIGQVQLKKLNDFVEKRRKNHSYYREKLGQYEDIFTFQEETKGGAASWFGFNVILKENCPFSLSDITEYLKQNNIESRPIIAGNIAKHPVMQRYSYKASSNLENANYVMNNGFSLGCHQHVGQQAIDYVCGHIESFVKKNNPVLV